MLSVNQLSINNQSVSLLNKVSFEVRAGECVGIIGASGSGKSLLAHALFGVTPDGFELSGNVCVQGELALIPQSRSSFNPSSLIKRQIERRRSSNDAMHRVIGDLELEDTILCRYPGQLSGGMAKRALTAMAMVQESRIIVADEPTAGLDSQRSDAIFRQVSSLKNRDKGVVIISHDVVTLSRIADKILVFKQGSLIDATSYSQMMSGHCHPYTRQLWLAAPENWNWRRDAQTA